MCIRPSATVCVCVRNNKLKFIYIKIVMMAQTNINGILAYMKRGRKNVGANFSFYHIDCVRWCSTYEHKNTLGAFLLFV